MWRASFTERRASEMIALTCSPIPLCLVSIYFIYTNMYVYIYIYVCAVMLELSHDTQQYITTA